MQLTRSIFIESIQATSQDWILGIVWALVVFILGFWFFFKGEGKYGRD